MCTRRMIRSIRNLLVGLCQRTLSLFSTSHSYPSYYLGKIGGRRRSGWQRMRWLDGITNSMDVFVKAPEVCDGQESLACYSPWGRKELDMTDRLNWTELIWISADVAAVNLWSSTYLWCLNEYRTAEWKEPEILNDSLEPRVVGLSSKLWNHPAKLYLQCPHFILFLPSEGGCSNMTQHA